MQKSKVLDRKIILEEQGLRDGLQMLSQIISTEQKLKWVEQMISAGIKRIQVASFVDSKITPQMADAEDIFKGLPNREDVVFSAFALNKKGVERAIASGVKHLSVSISASDTHSKKNTGLTLDESLKGFQEMVALAKKNGIRVRGGIQCAFGCRYEGGIDPRKILQLVRGHLDLQIDELALADSTGMADPMTMKNIMGDVMLEAFDIPIILHLHNTENKGLANVYAAIQVGVKMFDTAFGGLGGCPFIKGATGNIATEDTVHMLKQMGFDTGIDIRKIANISLEMESFLGYRLPGAMHRIIQ